MNNCFLSAIAICFRGGILLYSHTPPDKEGRKMAI